MDLEDETGLTLRVISMGLYHNLWDGNKRGRDLFQHGGWCFFISRMLAIDAIYGSRHIPENLMVLRFDVVGLSWCGDVTGGFVNYYALFQVLPFAGKGIFIEIFEAGRTPFISSVDIGTRRQETCRSTAGDSSRKTGFAPHHLH